MAITELDAPMPTMIPKARKDIPLSERLIVALDVNSENAAKRVVEALGDNVDFYKIGLGLQFRGGIALAEELHKWGKKVFLDAKIYDVGATTKAAVESITKLGVDFVTIHGSTEILKEAVAGRGNHHLKLFAITVLTSMDDDDLRAMGYLVGVNTIVDYKTKSAIEAGCDGVITSGLEAEMCSQIARDAGAPLIIVTPGIRSEGISRDDQKRVATPEAAFKAGADYIVMGRQILRAKNQRDEAKRVLDTIDTVLSRRP